MQNLRCNFDHLAEKPMAMQLEREVSREEMQRLDLSWRWERSAGW